MIISICQLRLRVGERWELGWEELGFELGSTDLQSLCLEPLGSTALL